MDENSQKMTINSNSSPYNEGPKRSNSQKDPPNVNDGNGNTKIMVRSGSELDNRNFNSDAIRN